MRWIRAKYAGKHRLGMRALRRRFCGQRFTFACNGVAFTGASSVVVTRYRYRGQHHRDPMDPETSSRGHQRLSQPGKTRGAPGAVRGASQVREGARGRQPAATPAPRPRAYLTTC